MCESAILNIKTFISLVGLKSNQKKKKITFFSSFLVAARKVFLDNYTFFYRKLTCNNYVSISLGPWEHNEVSQFESSAA